MNPSRLLPPLLMKSRPHRCLALLAGGAFLAGAGVVQAEAPANDLRAHAAPLALEQPVAGTTAGATVEEGEPLPEIGYRNTVWYVWTAEGPGPWEARVSYSSGYTSLSVYEEDDILREVAGGSFFRSESGAETIYSRAARFHSATGQRLWFQIYASGAQEFTLELHPLTGIPAEDSFAQAALLPSTVTAHPIPTASATLEPGEPPANRQHGSLWYRWSAPSAGFWLLKFEGISGAGVDAWRGTTLADLTSAVVAGTAVFPPDGSDPPPSLRAVVRAEAGETLHVRVLTADDATTALTIKPATPGDMFDEPVDLGAEESASHTRLLADAVTVERGEGSFHTGSQWMAWICPTEGIYEVEASAPKPSSGWGTISGMDPIIEVYQGDTLATLTQVPAVPLGIVRQPLRFQAQAGERFVIRAGLTPFAGFIGPTNGGGVTLSFGPTSISVLLRRLGPSPANDDFAAAGDLGSTLDLLVTGDNTGAGHEPGEPRGAYEAGDSVWHRWAAPAAGRYEYLGESPVYLTPKIYRGATLDDLVLAAAGAAGYGTNPPGHARLRFDAAEGEVFHIRLAGNGYGRQGAYSFSLRRLHSPANDLLAHAIALTGDLPLEATGDTTDAGVETPPEYSLEAWSSVWWKWTATESGWFELRGNAHLGVLENGNRYGYTLSSSNGFFRFQAAAGRVYHFRLAHHKDAEGPVALTLDRVSGLEHASAQTALEAEAALRFSTPPVPVAAGTYHLPNGSGSGALWLRWTPPASGWVSVDTGGSEGEVGLTAFAAENLSQALASSSFAGFIPGWTGPDERASTWTRPLEDPVIRRDLSLAGETRRLLLRVTAGRTYYIRAMPDGRLAFPQVCLNARLAGPPPALHAAHTRLRQANGASWLEVRLTVSTPNGFVEGVLSQPDQIQNSAANPIRFYDAHRIGGDAFAGEYRVMLPAPQTEAPYSFEPRVQIRDAAGGELSIQPAAQEIEPTPGPAILDNLPPQLDGVIASPPYVALDGEDVTVKLQLGISDAGGSGFAEGEIYLSSDSVATSPLQVVRFGSAQRQRGDGELGVYEVAVTIPAATPDGTVLKCLLRDAAGNAAGRWDYPVQSRPGTIIISPSVVITPVFDPVHVLPLVIAQRRPPDVDPPVIHDTTAEYLPGSGADGEMLLRARLTDTGSGLAGGRVVLADEHGLIATIHTFDASARVSGTAADGDYQLRIPLPAYGFGGPHRLRWEAQDAAGNPATPLILGPFILPDRTTGDQRRPRLIRLQISPSSVDLLAGPSTVQLSLAVNDDRPGTTARALVFDSHGRELATGGFLCLAAAMECEIDLSLPQVLTTGPSAEARVVVELTDAAGRTETYGPFGAAAWPDASAASLRLAPSVPGAFARWSAAWPGLAGLPADASRDTDNDSRPDLLEFALGTDPTRPDAGDPFAGRTPRLSLSGPFSSFSPGTPPQRLVSWSFQPAPWFAHDTDRFRADGWELIAETSTDLGIWEILPASPGGAIFPAGNHPADRVTIQQMPPVTDSSRWYRLNVRHHEHAAAGE